MRTRTSASPAVFVNGAIIMAAGLVGVYVLFVRTVDGQRIDELAFNGAQLGQRTLAPITLRLLDSLPTVAVGVAVVLAIVVSAVRRNWLVLALAVSAALAANVSTQVLKAILTRPDVGIEGYAFNSLPSGHTTVAASAALVVFLVSSRRMRPSVAFVGAIFTVAAGIATLANQWHRPSDVLAGLIVVAFWGCIAGAIIVRMQPMGRVASGPPGRSTMLWIGLPFALLTSGALVLAYLEIDGSLGLLVAYGGGASAVVATGFLLASAATRVFRSLQ